MQYGKILTDKSTFDSLLNSMPGLSNRVCFAYLKSNPTEYRFVVESGYEAVFEGGCSKLGIQLVPCSDQEFQNIFAPYQSKEMPKFVGNIQLLNDLPSIGPIRLTFN